MDKPLSPTGADVPVLAGVSEVGVDRLTAELEGGVEREVLDATDKAVIWYCGLSRKRSPLSLLYAYEVGSLEPELNTVRVEAGPEAASIAR